MGEKYIACTATHISEVPVLRTHEFEAADDVEAVSRARDIFDEDMLTGVYADYEITERGAVRGRRVNL